VQTELLSVESTPPIQRQVEGEEEEEEEVVEPRSETSTVSSDSIRYVQRAVTWIQAKLKIGQPNDWYEQEADRVADQIMAMPNPTLKRQIESEEEEEALQTKLLADQITPLMQREEELPDEEEEELQVKLKPVAPSTVTPSLESRINSLKGGGQPLDPTTRNFFEPRFGTDFSGVRIHTDSNANHLARSINCKAFTFGQEVVFGSGQYSPGSRTGRSLLAHEITHVLQQSERRTDSKNNKTSELEFLQHDTNATAGKFSLDPNPLKLSRIDANVRNVIFREEIQLRSTNRVADTTIRSQDNRREEVLRLLDRLHRLWAITNTNYANQFRYIHALPRGSQVPQTGRGGWSFRLTMEAITRVREPLMARDVIMSFMQGISVTGSVGRRGNNNKADVLSVMDRLNFITPYSDWASERRVVAAAATPTVSESAFAHTLYEISRFKIGIASARLGWLPTRASERQDEGDRFAGQTTSHTVTVQANHTGSNARRAETRETISVSIFLSSMLPANENRVFLFFSPGDGTEVNPRAPGGNATNVHAMRSGADPAGWILIGIPGFRVPGIRPDLGWNSFDIAAIHSCLIRAGRPARIDRLRAAAHSRGGRGLTRTINRGFIPGSNFERVIFLDQPHGALLGLRRGVLVDYTKGGDTGRGRIISALGSRAIGFARLIADRPDVPAPAPARALIAALGPLPPRGSFTTQPVPAGTTGRINLHSWVGSRSHWSAIRAIGRADQAAQSEWFRFVRNPSRPLNRSIVDQSPWFHVNVEDLMRFFGRRLINSSGMPVARGFSLGIYAHHLFVAEISEELFQ
ncbi:MAG TPA: DUF4157 domain-containing protein, partial [Anaerolineales bacterium]|nr:DUF4157 domain-containing protein [Anaerolineales bacterium]